METKNIIMVVMGLTIAGLLVFTGTLIGNDNNSVTGAVTGITDSSGMSSEGFASQEEMMEAHHGKKSGSAASSDGCGGVAKSTGDSSSAEFLGKTSDYGVTYDDAGYAKLVEASTTIKLSAEQTKTIVGLNVELPCCGVKTLMASGNCQCGHHVALHGLATLMASKGYDSSQIQLEINKWKEVFFPSGSEGNTGGC